QSHRRSPSISSRSRPALALLSRSFAPPRCPPKRTSGCHPRSERKTEAKTARPSRVLCGSLSCSPSDAPPRWPPRSRFSRLGVERERRRKKAKKKKTKKKKVKYTTIGKAYPPSLPRLLILLLPSPIARKKRKRPAITAEGKEERDGKQ